MEGVLAAFAQFDSDVRSDRTRAGMKAALELGRWVFLAPVGYLNAPRAMGKNLMHDPERGSLVRRAFEEYATGRFTKEQLLKRVRTWGLTNRRGKPAHVASDRRTAAQPDLRGIINVPEYGVLDKRGDFEPLISEDLFYQVQAVLSGRTSNTAPRQRAHPDFPLRGFVRCASCGRGLTGSWSKARHVSTEVALRKGAAGARLQVALEGQCAVLARKLHGDDQLPRAMLGSVIAASCVVPFDAGCHIAGRTDVEPVPVGRAAKSVDESFGHPDP
jgi:hypothetical protein